MYSVCTFHYLHCKQIAHPIENTGVHCKQRAVDIEIESCLFWDDHEKAQKTLTESQREHTVNIGSKISSRFSRDMTGCKYPGILEIVRSPGIVTVSGYFFKKYYFRVYLCENESVFKNILCCDSRN